mgnify:CR=1 FL=1
MPTYAYKAKRGPVETVSGEVQAESRGSALELVEHKGLTPVWVREKEGDSTGRGWRRWWPGRVSARDVTIFTRQLGSLTRSGVPILRALGTIAQQTDSPRFRRLVETVEADIRDGGTLSTALARHAESFPSLYIAMVRSGESGGVLDKVLDRLAAAREKEEDIRRRVQAAVAYPALIVTVGAATVFVLLAFFLPRVVELFRDYSDLPLPTRLLIGISDFCSDSWYWILLGAVLVAALFNRLAAIDKGRFMIDRLRLHLPLLGRIEQQSDVARFARTLALMVDSGIAIDRALLLSADTMRNAVFREAMHGVRESTVQQGLPLSAGLKRAKLFPVFLANMVGVGEESGRLDESLVEVADFYEKEFEQQTRLVTSLLEPILILVVGLVVGFIVSAMLLPIFEIGAGV